MFNFSTPLFVWVGLWVLLSGCADTDPSAGPIGQGFKEADRERSAKIIDSTIRRKLGKPSGTLTQTDMDQVDELNLSGRGITDISSLSRLPNLKGLGLNHNQLTDLTPLAGLRMLRRLEITANPGLKEPEINRLKAALPNCKIDY
jgi:Leucine-rich repeat (LRR) protein